MCIIHYSGKAKVNLQCISLLFTRSHYLVLLIRDSQASWALLCARVCRHTCGCPDNGPELVFLFLCQLRGSKSHSDTIIIPVRPGCFPFERIFNFSLIYSQLQRTLSLAQISCLWIIERIEGTHTTSWPLPCSQGNQTHLVG